MARMFPLVPLAIRLVLMPPFAVPQPVASDPKP